MNKILFILLLGIAPLFCEEEIRVELSTQEKLTPLYLNRWHTSGQLSSAYVQELQNVLKFDMQYSGYSKVLPSDERIEKALSASDPNAAFQVQNCGSALHVFKGVVEEKKLSLFIFSPRTGKLKQFQNIELTGNSTQDRRQIHKLADAALKALFDKPAIANSRILYSVQLNPQDQNWRAEIWECDWDGGNAKQVTQERSYALTPVLIPFRDAFLYVCYKNGLPKIYISSFKTPAGRRLLDIRGNQLLPAISPQRDKIAFICDVSGRPDLFIQSLDSNGAPLGQAAQLFSFPNSAQASPSFNPDGSKLAFVSDKDGSARIYAISTQVGAKRNEPLLITRANRENTCPSWSPDGTKLAYSAKSNGIRQIWIYDFASKEERQLTSGPGNKENPVWAPDSLHLLFNSTDPSSSELFLVNLNQPEAIQISKGPGKKHYPTWGTR